MSTRIARLAVALAVTFAVALPVAGHAAKWQMLDEEASGPFALGGSVTVTNPATLDLMFLLCGNAKDKPTSYYLARVTAGRAAFSKVKGDQTTPLGLAGEAPAVDRDQKVPFALHYDGWRLALIWNRRVVATAYDSDLTGPAVGHQAAAGCNVDEAYLQDVGEIDRGDTFMREEGSKDEWEVLGGRFHVQSLREDPQAASMQADKSVNPFSYYGTADDVGLALLGSWYWRSCTYSIAVRGRGEEAASGAPTVATVPTVPAAGGPPPKAGALGLAFYAQDKSNYLLLRWQSRFTSAPEGPRLQLIAVTDGRRQVLAEKPGGYFPNQWYQLRAQVCDDCVSCFVDDEPVFRVTTPLLGQGKIGVYVEGSEGAWFKDVRVTNWQTLRDDLQGDVAGKWTPLSGAWRMAAGKAQPDRDAVCETITGGPRWGRYAFHADVSCLDAGAGLLVACPQPTTGYAFRWAGRAAQVPYAGKAQIASFGPDGTRVLAEAPLATELPVTCRARALVEDGYIAGELNGVRVVDALVPRPTVGKVGLYSEGSATTVFSRVGAEAIPERRLARVTKEFTDTSTHFEMVEWASTRHAWIKPGGVGGPATWWTKGDYYGDLDVRFALKNVGGVAGTMSVVLGAREDKPTTGVRLAITATGGSKTLRLKLTDGDKELGSAEAVTQADPCLFVIEKRGDHLVVLVEDKPVLQVTWQPEP